MATDASNGRDITGIDQNMNSPRQMRKTAEENREWNILRDLKDRSLFRNN